MRDLLRAFGKLTHTWPGRVVLVMYVLALAVLVWLTVDLAGRVIRQPDLIPGLAGMLVFGALLMWSMRRLDSLSARVKKLESAREEEHGKVGRL